MQNVSERISQKSIKHFYKKAILFKFTSVAYTFLTVSFWLKFLDSLAREEDVLEWLIENKSTGDDDDVIEDVSGRTLQTLIGNADKLVVYFCKFLVFNLFQYPF